MLILEDVMRCLEPVGEIFVRGNCIFFWKKLIAWSMLSLRRTINGVANLADAILVRVDLGMDSVPLFPVYIRANLPCSVFVWWLLQYVVSSLWLEGGRYVLVRRIIFLFVSEDIILNCVRFDLIVVWWHCLNALNVYGWYVYCVMLSCSLSPFGFYSRSRLVHA